MYKNQNITAVVPAHNEAAFIGEVVRTMPPLVDQIVVVDDHSTDDTSRVARQQGDGRVVVLRSDLPLGVGGATLLGYSKALELGSDIVVKIDGDGQMPPEYLPALLDAVVEDGYRYAKGNRFLAGRSLHAMPRHRLFGNIILTFMTKLASGYWHIFDPQNGYTAAHAGVLRTLDFERIDRGYFFEGDMLLQLNLQGVRVRDVAIPARYGDERSGINPFMVAVIFPLLLTRRFFHRVYRKYVLQDFSPIALFLFSGLALFGWGAAFGAYLWIRGIQSGVPTPTGTIMLAILPLILGFQLLLQAIVLDIHETPR